VNSREKKLLKQQVLSLGTKPTKFCDNCFTDRQAESWTTFLRLHDIMEQLINKSRSIIQMGDFNVNINNKGPSTKQ
jgi:hypothetical protein